MSIESLTPRIIWNGNGSTDTLSLTADGQPLVFTAASEITIQQRIVASGDISNLTLGVHYNLSGYPVTSAGPAATLTRIGGNLPSGYTWAILRTTPATQTLDISQGGDFSSSVIEAAFDRAVIQIQELREILTRAFVLSIFDGGAISPTLPTAQALNYIRWNAAANALEGAAQIDMTGTTVSSYIENLLDDASAADARTTLGLGSLATQSMTITAFAQTLLDDANVAAARTTLELQALATLTAAAVAAGRSPSADGAGAVAFSNVCPIGAILMWATATPPTGWLECDGAAVSRTTYAALFAIIGSTYGNGDGSTTFNLPDTRARFVRGWDHGAGVDPDAASRTNRGDGTTGNNVGTKQADQYLSHTHGLIHNPTNIQATPSGVTGFFAFGLPDTGATQASGGNETRPKNIYFMHIIRALA